MAHARRSRLIRPSLRWLAYAVLSGALALLAVALAYLTPWQAALAHGLHLSLVAWILYAFDKRRAQTGWPRVREANLLGLAFAGGALGAWVAMLGFRHKTRQPRFTRLVPLALVTQVAFVVWLALR